jgi:hypothetical protein
MRKNPLKMFSLAALVLVSSAALLHNQHSANAASSQRFGNCTVLNSSRNIYPCMETREDSSGKRILHYQILKERKGGGWQYSKLFSWVQKTKIKKETVVLGVSGDKISLTANKTLVLNGDHVSLTEPMRQKGNVTSFGCADWGFRFVETGENPF